jgi:hypothetical protein
MKVILKSSGGWSAGLRAPDKVVDTALLPDEEAEEASRLVEAAKAAVPGSGSDSPSTSAPEAMRYTLTVEGDEGPVTLKASDVDLSPAMAGLIQWVERQARKPG